MSLTKIIGHVSFRRIFAMFVLAGLITVKLTGVLSAQSVTKGYGSDETLRRGLIVGLQTGDTSKVRTIDTTQESNILGVVVNPSDSPISVSTDNQRIFVATGGRYDVFVDDQQGAIKTGDYITVSALSGVGMKASREQSFVVGRAAESYDGKVNVLSSSILKDAKGNDKIVNIGRIAVEVSVGKNPLVKIKNSAPSFLSNAGESIAGKSVSAVRLYLSALIFIIGTVIAGAIMYAGVRSSIIAIGRNPLSKRSILRSLLGVTVTGFSVFLVCVIGVYLLLKV